MTDTCPLCGSTFQAPLVCEETGCGQVAGYAEMHACGCVQMLCIPHAQTVAAERAWASLDGRRDYMCPVCLTTTHHERTERVG
jgi:hypothetical protein